MSTSPHPRGRRPGSPSGLLGGAIAGCLLICSGAGASTLGDGTPPDLVPVVPAVTQPVLRDDSLGEVQREQRLRELRRQLLEHSRSWRGDAALRRSAAMPEPGDSPEVIADKILPLAPLPAGDGGLSAGATSTQPLPLMTPAGVGRPSPALPDAVPAALDAPVAPALPGAALPQGPEAVQAAAGAIKSGTVADTLSGSDQRLTERERRQLRQQLRQVLRLQEPAGNR
jgi:hypothetical protein